MFLKHLDGVATVRLPAGPQTAWEDRPTVQYGEDVPLDRAAAFDQLTDQKLDGTEDQAFQFT